MYKRQVKLDICKGSVSFTTKQGAMADSREPEVTGVPSADARSGVVGDKNFALKALPVGSETGSSKHSQIIKDNVIMVSQFSVIEPLHADVNIAVDSEVQALFAAHEGGMDLSSSQNLTPQPFVYESVATTRAQSHFSARSQNNELVEMVTKLVADNRAEIIRREQ